MAGGLERESREGLILGASAFVLWGLYPFYFKALAAIDPLEVVAHRIVWSFVVLLVAMPFAGRWREVAEALLHWRSFLGLLLTTVLILVNWIVYVLAVVSGNVLDTSLGYFLCPLVAVALGVFVLKERLSPWQLAAVALALAAVVNLILQLGIVPRVALVLAVSFGVYGLVRKKLRVGPVSGLFVECLLALPVAVGVIWWKLDHGGLGFLHVSPLDDLLLLLAGVATIGPLLLFNMGAKRLSYSTIGLLQYIAPSMLFLESVLLFGEPLEFWRLATFLVIWLALAIYTLDSLHRARRLAAAG
jgi:chloramphenicol-sensitive protein RarD